MQQEKHHVRYCEPGQNPTTWEAIGPRMELTIAILLKDSVLKLPLNMFIPTELSCSQAWPEKCLLVMYSNNSMQIHNPCVEKKCLWLNICINCPSPSKSQRSSQ